MASMKDYDSDGNEVYYIEVITGARRNGKGKPESKHNWEYHVKWALGVDSWEPYEHVKDCGRLLSSFWIEIGRDARNYDPEVAASKQWIDNERQTFLTQYLEMKGLGVKKKQKTSYDSAERQASTSKQCLRSHRGGTTRKAKRPQVISSDSESDVPLAKVVKLRPALKLKSRTQAPSPVDPPFRGSPSPIDEYALFGTPPRDSTPCHSPARSPTHPPPARAPPSETTNPVFSLPASSNSTSHANLSAVMTYVTGKMGSLSAGISSTTRAVPSANDQAITDETMEEPHTAHDADPSDEPEATDADVGNLFATIAPALAVHSQHPDNVVQAESPMDIDTPDEDTWRWTGKLYIDNELGAAARLCEVAIENPFCEVESGYKLEHLFDQTSLLRLEKMYRIPEFNLILRSLSRVDHFATLSHKSDVDATTFRSFATYLSENKLISRSPLKTDFGYVAEIIIFSPDINIPCSPFTVPSNFQKPGQLVVAVMPLHAPPPKDPRRRSVQPVINFVPADTQYILKRELRPKYMYDITFLGFPEWLFNDIVKSQRREYCIWSDSVERAPVKREYPINPKEQSYYFPRPKPETAALVRIVHHLGARNVGYNSDVKYLFIHVGAMHTLSNLPALVERRMRRPEIRFIMYGAHSTVHPSRWGIREVFPLGGIMTFTHKAILEHPDEVKIYIEKVAKHPFWECYVLPTVIGMVLSTLTSAQREDALAINDDTPFGHIIHQIVDGKLALMRSPPNEIGVTPERKAWVVFQIKHLRKSSRDVVRECQSEFERVYCGKEKCAIEIGLENEIFEDMNRLQHNPLVQDEYRRFVVMQPNSYCGELDHRALECPKVSVPEQKFLFRDALHPDERKT